jgi:hypothetical protein
VLGGALILLGACGEPPQPLPTSPPYVTPSADPISLSPSLPMVNQPLPTVTNYPTLAGTYPTYTLNPTTLGPETISPTPTPSHAARCPGPPTGAQILTLIKKEQGVPKNKTLRVVDGPRCSGDWSFTAVEVSGEDADQLEPLMVVATGKDSTLALVAAGSEVCIDQVEHGAPPGIRVLACGF